MDVGQVLMVSAPSAEISKFALTESDTSAIDGNINDFKSSVIDINMYDKSNNNISEVPSYTRTVTIDYSGLDIIDSGKLVIFWYDPITNKWYDAATVRDLVRPWDDGTIGYIQDFEAKTISLRLAHFSVYGLFPTKLEKKYAHLKGNAPQTAPSVGALADIKIYPNPFKPNDGNSNTGIEYDGSVGSGIYFNVYDTEIVTIKIYNVAGELVKTLVDNNGDNAIQWDARNSDGRKCGSGVYIAVINNGTIGRIVKKFIIIR